jgi:DNA (cytosine-5)-methyltransferase 1
MSRRIGRETKSEAREAALPTFFEFFAGGGMVRAGLKGQWRCTFANDFDHKKASTYRTNWGDNELAVKDVRSIAPEELPERADLIWASFPCQDLSLAGAGAGLQGDRSGTFIPFWKLVKKLRAANRSPKVIVLENVCGALTSHGGKDFEAIVRAFSEIDFDVGAVVIDAELFVPQSRPRLFFIGVPRRGDPKPFALLNHASNIQPTAALKRAYSSLPPELQRRWIWWSIPLPSARRKGLSDIIVKHPRDVEWHSPGETRDLLSMMSPINRKKVQRAQLSKTRMVGAMYRRTRPEGDKGVQRVEVRFDNVAGCLRTPAGGSSRQLILVVEGKSLRSRLISARETARLMGLPDSYRLPARYNDAYHLTGDGVVVDVVRHLSEHVLLPAIAACATKPARKRVRRAA